jgi:PAS domain S-box-containing protein
VSLAQTPGPPTCEAVGDFVGEQEDTAGRTPPFRELTEALGLGMPFQIRASADGLGREFTFVGSNCLTILGVEPQAAMADARLLFDQILPDQREAFAAAERAAFDARRSFEMDVQMQGPDGAIRWRRIVSAPTVLPDGSSLWDGLLTDITEAHAAAAELQEQRRRLEAAVEATGLGLWDWDVRAGTLIWSARNRELFGVAPDQPMTIELYLSQVHEEDREGLRQAYRQVAETPEGGDFVHEYRTAHQPGGKTRWVQTRGRVTRDEQGVLLAVGTTLDISDRKASEERRALLLGELSHRAKNGIAVMMAIVSQTARGANSVEAFKDVLMARLQAMADSQDLVTQTGGRTVPLADLVATTLTPFDSARFDVDNGLGEVTAPAELATALGLLLHELATNAVKYGALSNTAGRVAIASTAGPSGEIVLQWLERGGPTVRPVERKGFGSRLLEVSLRNQGGRVEPVFEPDGFKATIHLPKVVPRSTQPSGLTASA